MLPSPREKWTEALKKVDVNVSSPSGNEVHGLFGSEKGSQNQRSQHDIEEPEIQHTETPQVQRTLHPIPHNQTLPSLHNIRTHPKEGNHDLLQCLV
jgi:hypothetical protein